MSDARDAQYEHLYEARRALNERNKALNDRNSIIEECARVADYWSAWDKTDIAVGEKTAAAIRALKDEP